MDRIRMRLLPYAGLMLLGGSLLSCEERSRERARDLPLFLELSRSESEGDRRHAAEFIGAGAPEYHGGVPALIELLSDPSQAVAGAALESLAQYPSDFMANGEPVARCVERVDLESRLDACSNLLGAGRKEVEIAVWLAPCLKLEDELLLIRAVEHLGSFGPSATFALPDLLVVLRRKLPRTPVSLHDEQSGQRRSLITSCIAAATALDPGALQDDVEVAAALQMVQTELSAAELELESALIKLRATPAGDPSLQELHAAGVELQERRDRLDRWKQTLSK